MTAAPELKYYDPNVRRADHVVEVTYMLWDYRLIATVQIGGNTRGASILRTAIHWHAEKLFKEQGDVPTLFLTKAGVDDQEEQLESTCDVYVRDTDTYPDIEMWLEMMCIGVRIVEHKTEVREAPHEVL